MKKILYIHLLVSSLLTLFSCSDKFLEEKRDMTAVNEEVFQDPVLAQAYVDYVYGLFLPANNGTGFISTNTASESGSYNNIFAQTTDELAGETDFNKEWAAISFVNNHANKYFGQRMSTNINNNTWTRLRQINLFLSEIDKHGMGDDLKNPLKGQMYFWRAWQYFELVRLYGGVPLVLVPQSPSVGDIEENSVPRSSTSDCIEQICADLDMAVELLPGSWSGANWGRITSGAAAAVKGRVLLTWASPIYNPNDDVERWQAAYDANQEAKTLLVQNGFGLYTEGNLANGEAWGNMWFKEEGNPEAIIVFGFNNMPKGGNFTKNSGWEQAIRPREISGGGSVTPTKQIVEAFPMKDGKRIDDASSAYVYDANKFYKNRDPRFYKSFAYNGAIWPFAGEEGYRVWTYSWKENANGAYKSTETRGANGSGIYVRKASNINASNAINNFEESGTDFMEYRFAELVLNIAECAVGINRLNEGLEGLKAIRERAGVENNDGSYGLAAVAGNRDKLFKAILDERKVELAYEGKRFYDLRRWMLFDNETGMNTRLGIPVLNGTRRTGYRITVRNEDVPFYSAVDPLLGEAAPLVNRNATSYPEGIATYDEYVDYLYDNYFLVEERDDLDRTNVSPAWTFRWYPEYYYFGIHQGVLEGSPYLEQTKGWNSFDGAGTFDPLQ
ncbi:RagB/SusD family nutrient uptake outer membrane protein [Sphingobacterium sp. DN00404]|uniref:RagB/SusD family nutrient uptake outer membrane protein n=1 Tax=Sphingobacterium micropteri TaxID=2763501 RepID=A0ABR7YPE2_9SPHI|nr:RagB/SusD family nutrient uptake outer membrane protein [Sphingobacterium micropteri]MBD1433208.1 RagB/SusD family nutrient uptake outer membrane protein [Sphingobacterium micropteri]